jgi:hypothetical protein
VRVGQSRAAASCSRELGVGSSTTKAKVPCLQSFEPRSRNPAAAQPLLQNQQVRDAASHVPNQGIDQYLATDNSLSLFDLMSERIHLLV